MDGEEGMHSETTPEPVQVPHYVTVTFPPDGDVQIGGNATIVELLAGAELLRRAAGGMLDQAELSALQATQRILTPLDHLPKGGRHS